jgi:ABC-type branched-subunit amino acid transport system substrate-binding protein
MLSLKPQHQHFSAADPNQSSFTANQLDYTAVSLCDRIWRFMLHFMLVCLALLSVVTVQAAIPPVKLGMSAPLSGVTVRLGQDYQAGASLVFDRINQQGGIAGRPLQLICLDDGYDPLRTVANTKSLLFEHQVTALFGYIGTPTSNAILPMLRQLQIPYLAAFSGADLLRQPQDQFIFNFRASYAQEAAAQIRYLVDQQKLRRIALLIQADEFGATLEQHFLQQLQQRGVTPVLISRFARNTADVSQVVAELQRAAPELVLTVGTYPVLSKLIHRASQQGFQPVFSVVSFTGVSELAKLLPSGSQVLASMVVPDPVADPSKLSQAYRTAALASGQQPNDIGLEAFAAATLLVQALQSCTPELSRTCVLQQLPQQRLFDFPLHYDQQRHQASQQIYLMQLTDQRLLPVKQPPALQQPL